MAVFTLGLSPPIATEFLMGLLDRGVEVNRAIPVTTMGALSSFHALKLALYWSSRVDRFPDLAEELRVYDLSHVTLTLKQLTLDDIVRVDDCRTFRTQFNAALKTAVKWTEGDIDKVYVCIAGGRKTMPIDATLVCIAESVRNVYHVIAPKIPGIAEDFAKLVSGGKKIGKLDHETVHRDELLKMLAECSEAPEMADDRLVKYVLKVCFPPKTLEFHLVRIPIPRLSPSERERFHKEVK